MAHHSYFSSLQEQLADGRLDRREFVRYSALLGVSATAAYAVAGNIVGEDFAPKAVAQDMPVGGSMRIAMRVYVVNDPHTFSWVIDSNIARQVCGYLSRTGTDNVTRPDLLSGWEASDDLLTWTLNVREGVNWHDGRAFTAEDIAWNLNHVLNPETGSSVLGLMKGYMMNDAGDALWDANAIEIIDDNTVRLNTRSPNIAIAEHLFHYPLLIVDPADDGFFGVGSNGTGAFKLTEHVVGEKATLENANNATWHGEGPYLDRIEFIDLGDDPSAAIGAVASKQVHAVDQGDIVQLDAYKAMPHVEVNPANTAQTGVARVQADNPPFDDPRVRKAMRLAVDTPSILEAAHRGLGAPAEHHHVAPIHPDYAELPFMSRDVEAAKALLAEAGHPDGIEAEISCKKDPAWELLAVQAMVEQWKEAGINVSINVLPSDQFWEVWDKVPFGFTSWTHRPLGFMVLGLAYRSGVPWNESHYANAEFDAKLTQAEGIVDVDARREIMAELEIIMQEDGPIIQPLWRAIYNVSDTRVMGYGMHPTSYIFGENLAIAS
ncbi:MAG: ABC transporter substrate-binding protein [Alphaproteobacteria bacterium]|jgi:peptide/nickel transport system substrate-binding protein|nr:ABC transporter substrate-binding protein [Rhodospirillaceae bacterium]MDG2482921.1 ABC transporter substrate-binding protein [Alphaproteobacteria bacterium]MBT6205186.1 ABC transporter substrate-binding protein [Rhodospirillaceae bacterium]MBT6509486.1 ABC transporter substrate-binding protein [Rhodospirillaceae bacterium]MBT7614947.1 ABC transporter substrate-binding protein [Rhodospirillaceae bacterium]